MSSFADQAASRRKFLGFLAGSPLLAAGGALAGEGPLGAFGQPGVERALELLRIELRAMMQQMGAPNLKALVPAMVKRA